MEMNVECTSMLTMKKWDCIYNLTSISEMIGNQVSYITQVIYSQFLIDRPHSEKYRCRTVESACRITLELVLLRLR